MIRIFISAVGAGAKGSNNKYFNDLESGQVGVYDDAVLREIDDLM